MRRRLNALGCAFSKKKKKKKKKKEGKGSARLERE